MNSATATLCLSNRQRACRLDLRLLRRITNTLVRDLMKVDGFDLGLFLVDAPEIVRLNERFLHHAGPTDVITFDYAQEPPPPPGGSAAGNQADHCLGLHAEVFVCVGQAAAQARRFRTTWQSELVRCIVHGILHLRGFDDRSPRLRRRMKRAEDRYLRQLARRFDLSRLG